VIIKSVTYFVQMFKEQSECHEELVDLLASMGDMLNIFWGITWEQLSCTKDVVREMLGLTREASELAGKFAKKGFFGRWKNTSRKLRQYAYS